MQRIYGIVKIIISDFIDCFGLYKTNFPILLYMGYSDVLDREI